MTVDLHTILKEQRETEPTSSHFLLLIVAGGAEESSIFRSSQELPAEPKK